MLLLSSTNAGSLKYTVLQNKRSTCNADDQTKNLIIIFILEIHTEQRTYTNNVLHKPYIRARSYFLIDSLFWMSRLANVK